MKIASATAFCNTGARIRPSGRACRRNDRFYIATEGWLFLAVIDFFSRQVIGWSLRSDMTRELVIVPNAVLNTSPLQPGNCCR